MPRNEGFLDPGAGPLASFAWDLRALREQAGMVPYRVLAKRAGFCASTLSVAASGAKLPSLDVTLAYVQACGGEPEVWRARWQTLAAQHQPASAQPAGVAPSGLEFAPPYDADDRDEQDSRDPDDPRDRRDETAALGTVPPDLSRDSNRSMDRDRVVLVAGNGVATVNGYDTYDALPVTAPGTAGPSVPTVGGRPSGGPRWRAKLPAMSLGRAATAALALATAVLGLKVLSVDSGDASVAGPPPAYASPADTAMQQADALYAVIYQATPFRSDTNDAIWDVNGCRNLSNAQSRLRAIARKRQEQVEQLAELHVSKVPDHDRLVAALKHAWITSAQTDTAYANIAADLQTGCTSGAIETDPSYQQADADAQAATAAKAEAARLWNSNADALGQLQISESEL